MRILLNKQFVAMEVITLAKLKIATILRIPEAAVVAKYVPGVGQDYNVEFGVMAEYAKGVSPDDIRQVLAKVWTHEMRPVFKERLKGLSQVRGR